MTAPSSERGEREWLPAAAFAFTLVALVVLAVIPALLLQRVSRLTEGITTIVVPAYDGLQDFAFSMERRAASARGQFLTGDPEYASQLAEARAAEAAALRTLEQLAPRLGAGADARLESLRASMSLRDSIEAEIIRGGADVAAYRQALPRFEELRGSMLAEVEGLRRELVRLTEARVAEAARFADLQRSASILLGMVALVAALLVGWFALRQRRLRRVTQRALDEANRQRAIAERRGEELERATEARVRLLRGITHDVKNPLGAARGYVDLLEMEVKAPASPEQRPLLKGIRRSVDSALAIISDLLDLARADRGGLGLDRSEVDLAEVVRQVSEDHRSPAEAAGHTTEIDLPAQPLTVYTDSARVEQILGNLFSNAIKYTPPPGRITVRAALNGGAGAPAQAAWATIRVTDTGPGIPVVQREAIFDEFTRLDDGGAKKGHGLGLAIARRIARILGGDLTVEDGPGGGATFILWLPVREPGPTPPSGEEGGGRSSG